MSLKEKIKVVLNQNGRFRCPNGLAQTASTPAPLLVSAAPQPPPPSASAVAAGALQAVIDNLKGRGKSKPRTQKTLVSTIKSLKPLALNEAKALAMVQRLQADKKIVIEGTKITYKL